MKFKVFSVSLFKIKSYNFLINKRGDNVPNNLQDNGKQKVLSAMAIIWQVCKRNHYEIKTDLDLWQSVFLEFQSLFHRVVLTSALSDFMT